jgi:hypothetical protein
MYTEGWTCTVTDSVRLTTPKDFRARSDRKKAKKIARVEVGELSQRRCGRCGKVGHNLRTCRQEAAIDSE